MSQSYLDKARSWGTSWPIGPDSSSRTDSQTCNGCEKSEKSEKRGTWDDAYPNLTDEQFQAVCNADIERFGYYVPTRQYPEPAEPLRAIWARLSEGTMHSEKTPDSLSAGLSSSRAYNEVEIVGGKVVCPACYTLMERTTVVVRGERAYWCQGRRRCGRVCWIPDDEKDGE